jgi:hypothetical protein
VGAKGRCPQGELTWRRLDGGDAKVGKSTGGAKVKKAKVEKSTGEANVEKARGKAKVDKSTRGAQVEKAEGEAKVKTSTGGANLEPRNRWTHHHLGAAATQHVQVMAYARRGLVRAMVFSHVQVSAGILGTSQSVRSHNWPLLAAITSAWK